MGFRKAVTAATVAVTMMVVPTLAQAASPASRLSVAGAAKARTGAAQQDESNLSGGSLILAIVAAAAVIAGIVVAVDGGNDNEGPVSP
ncbi:hypothetical protein ACFB49_39890 [Sphingomonas sp. DBB INV C78]|uniref:hypothetical protein n=1 Tax=Sphingomonas sp. DBB INV C78 TaxID=3349434 RepID=UPI0036D3C514